MACDRAFFGRLFAAHSIRSVFDIGANIGDKAVIFAEMAERLLCVEADPHTAQRLNFRFASVPYVVVKTVAVAAEDGTAHLLRKSHSGFSTLSEKWSHASNELGVESIGSVDVPSTTLDSLIARHGLPDYIKIDVEGYELPAIRGLSAAIKVISFEANVPTFLEETKEIIDRLRSLQPNSRFNLRILDAAKFHLPESVDADSLIAELDRLSPFTCDIFGFCTNG